MTLLLSLKDPANVGPVQRCVAGPVVVGAPAFLHLRVCSGRTHHQHPPEGAPL